MKSKLHIFLFTILFLGFSCGDDGEPDVTVVPEADRNEQQVIDNDSLLGYLQTHYINSSFLINNQNISLDEIIINSLPEDGGVSLPSRKQCTYIFSIPSFFANSNNP